MAPADLAPGTLPSAFERAADPGSSVSAHQRPGDGARPRTGPWRDGLGGPSREQQGARGDGLSQHGPGEATATGEEASRGPAAGGTQVLDGPRGAGGQETGAKL
eukprot:7945796-Alexandrium_andersonii.AAC.1